MKLQFSKSYFLIALVIFIAEVLIATVFQSYGFLRSYVGDVLVVMLIYYAIGSIFKISNKTLVLWCIFLFGVFVEFLQYFKIASQLGFSKNSLVYIVIGNTFSVEDIICYALGCVLVWLIER
ncbi:MAG: DUF2809 domain-containing protein [Bacteroidota bacterium]|nr:DUF2809 domain-containing protein [Bacteroidota bacterium]